ncbi:MAG: transglycosylase domain-containing protein [Anaerolineae bacterium]
MLSDQADSQRQWFRLADLPGYVAQATLRAEDPDYLDMQPESLFSTFSRLWENALFGSYRLDRSLTGRLVRGVIQPLPERPTSDAVGREIALVSEIERRYTPQEILEWYLNTMDYGNQAYGIQAAARTYLGKDAVELTLDEAAMLAAIPLATQYNPLDNETAARGRQRDLLRAMRTANEITSEQYDVAATTQTSILLTLNQPDQLAPAFVAYARRQAQDILNAQGRDGTQLVARGGLKIITTLDLDLYYQSECTLRAQMARLAGQNTTVETLDGQPCSASFDLPQNAAALAGSAPDTGTVVILDAATGEIKTMIGTATKLDAQPGPTLYPFVYFAGFVSARSTPGSMVLDIPRQFPGAAENLIYTPTNPDGRFRGPLNLRDAMSGWLLPPAAQVASESGLGRVLSFAHRIGLNSLGEDGRFDLSLLERGGAVSVLDMAYAYSVFASMGDMRGVPVQPVGLGYRQRSPVAVLRIEDEAGNIVWQYDEQQVALNQVGIYPHDVGYLLNDILADQTVRRQILGDSASVLDLNRKAAVVSGLAGDRTEDWTVGYTPQLVTAVYLKRGDGAALSLDPNGLQGAAAVWRVLTQYAHDRSGLPPADWARPDGVINLNICERSGLLANGDCPVRNELFLAAGLQPTETDTYWQKVLINSQTGQRATASTPNELRVSSLYFIPPDEARSWWEANNLPLPPTQYDSLSRPTLFSAVQILQPQPLAYVGGAVDVRGTMDTAGLKYFQLSYGQSESPTSFFSIAGQQTSFTQGTSIGTWDTNGLSGLYTLLLTVVREDNTSEQASVQVIVDNTAPTITLIPTEPGKVYRWPVDTVIPLEAAAQDDYQVQRVEFYAGDQLVATDTEAPYALDWTIPNAGDVVFTAVAFDAVGNQASSSVTVQVARG